MQPRILLDSIHFQITVQRLCYQLIENHDDFQNTCLIGVQPRGIHLSDRLIKQLKIIQPAADIEYGFLDPTFHRDDFRQKDIPIAPSETSLEFSVDNKKVVLIDDVLYTGRTIRAAMDALNYYGRPSRIELLVLIDRRFSRHVPVQPDYTGQTVDVVASELVKVKWSPNDNENEIWIKSENKADI